MPSEFDPADLADEFLWELESDLEWCREFIGANFPKRHEPYLQVPAVRTFFRACVRDARLMRDELARRKSV